MKNNILKEYRNPNTTTIPAFKKKVAAFDMHHSRLSKKNSKIKLELLNKITNLSF